MQWTICQRWVHSNYFKLIWCKVVEIDCYGTIVIFSEWFVTSNPFPSRFSLRRARILCMIKNGNVRVKREFIASGFMRCLLLHILLRPTTDGTCVCFDAGRPGVRLWVGYYQDFVNWYCSPFAWWMVSRRAVGTFLACVVIHFAVLLSLWLLQLCTSVIQI